MEVRKYGVLPVSTSVRRSPPHTKIGGLPSNVPEVRKYKYVVDIFINEVPSKVIPYCTCTAVHVRTRLHVF